MSHATLEDYFCHQQLLFGIAYRMLGTITDTEDILQDVLVDWQHKVEQKLDIASPKAYLASMITHKSIDYLRQAYVQRETYPGTWLPEPLVANDTDEFLDQIIVKDKISIAWLYLLERLSPIERAVYVLRTVFELDYNFIAQCVDKTATYCRKIMQRAQQHLESDLPRFDVTTTEHQLVVEQFLKAANDGDIHTLMETLLADATLVSDGGGQTSSPLWTVFGAKRIGRFMLGIRKKTNLPIRYQIVQINGNYAVVATIADHVLYAMVMSLQNGKIATIHNIRNPHKLEQVKRLGCEKLSSRLAIPL